MKFQAHVIMWFWPRSYFSGFIFSSTRWKALYNLTARLPDQIREAARKAPWALLNNSRVNILVICEEIITKVSIYLFASTEPRQFCANTNPTQWVEFGHLAHCDCSTDLYGLWANVTTQFQSTWSPRENSAREGTGVGVGGVGYNEKCCQELFSFIFILFLPRNASLPNSDSWIEPDRTSPRPEGRE